MPGIHYIDIRFDGSVARRIPGTSPDIFSLHDRYYQHYLWHSFPDSLGTCFVCGIDTPPPGYAVPERNIPENMFNFVLRGSGTVNGLPFRAGQFFTIPARMKNTMRNSDSDPWTIAWCSWRGCLPKGFERVLNSYTPLTLYELRNATAIRQLFEVMLYCDTYSANVPQLIDSFTKLLLSFLENRDTVEGAERSSLTHAQTYVNRAKELIARHYTTITVSELAQTLHLNRKYLSRIFSDATGITPQQYLIDTKLNCSEFYLIETDYSMEQIAAFCGYASYSSFIQAFQKKFGMSPRKYKEIYR